MIDRLLDVIALRSGFVNRLFICLGIVLAAFYWWQLTTTGGAPVDLRWYWEADPNNLYPNPELLQRNGYNYSPAFELIVGWGRLLPFETFVLMWRAMLLVTFVWLAGPLAVFVLFLYPVASEINAGNIQLLLAAAIVLGMRGGWWTSTWAFVLLTKVTPGVGLLWFALRRRWRELAIAIGVAAVIAAVTFVVWPDRWFAWLRLMTAGTPPPVSPFYLPFWPRFGVAVVIVMVAAWRGWHWPLVVAGTLALPAFYTISPSMLVGVLPFARVAAGRWTARRREAIATRGERLRAQGNPATDGILAG
jgi:hypothetical protein